MNVLMFIHSLAGGGAERVTVSLANGWVARGHAVTVVTLAPGDGDAYSLDPRVKRLSLGLVGESAGFWRAVAMNGARVRVLRMVLRRERPDVALAFMSASSVLLALASIGLRPMRYIGTERVYPPMHWLGRGWEWLRARTYGWLDAVVAQTNQSREWILANTNARRSDAIPNPISLPLAGRGPVVPPRSVGVPGRKRVLAVGRLEDQKGFDMLIDAFAAVTGDFPDWELVIVGEGPRRAELQLRVDSAGLTDRVLLPGFAGNVADWYADADIFALSSRFEGFANVLVEAMAHGLPAVSFDCDSGPSEIIRNELDGLLVPACDVRALSGALRRLMGDAAQRARLAARATDVRERYSLQRVLLAWERLFAELGVRADVKVADA